MLRTLAQNWWAVTLRGVCAVLFGLSAFIWSGFTALAFLVLFYSGYTLLDGFLAVAWALYGRHRGAFPWGVLLAGLGGITVGLVTLLSPGLTAHALLYVIALWAIVRGVFEIIAAFQLRRELEGEWFLAVSGLLSVTLGIVLAVAPRAGGFALLWWIGAFAIAFGVLTIILGVRLKGVKDQLARRPA
jgi:uncharacterized membrane protein HdeD (DUF308 family)